MLTTALTPLVTDSQVHLFPPASQAAALKFGHRVISPEELIAAMDLVGVSRAILVPPRVKEATNEGALAITARWPERFAVFGKVAPNQGDSLSLIQQRPTSSMLGLRVSFPPETSGLVAAESAELWRSAERHGIPMMVWSPGRLDELRQVAEHHPKLRLAVDHCGLGAADRGVSVNARLPELKRLAECPNVSVKVSALPTHSESGFPFEDLREFMSAIYSYFGARRMFWGSDLSGLPCGYHDCVRMFTEGFDFLSDEDVALIMGGSISDWLNWKVVGGGKGRTQ